LSTDYILLRSVHPFLHPPVSAQLNLLPNPPKSCSLHWARHP